MPMESSALILLFRIPLLLERPLGKRAYEHIRPKTKRLRNHNGGANKFRSG